MTTQWWCQFNSHFPIRPGQAGTWMSPFGILLQLRMTEVVSGDNRSYKTCKAPVKSLTQLFTSWMPFLSSSQHC